MITKNMITGIKVVFFIIFLILAFISIFFGDILGDFKILADIFSVLGFAVPALYSSFNYITVHVNKIILTLINTSVNWSSGIKFNTEFTEEINSINILNSKIMDSISEEYTVHKIEGKYVTLTKKSGLYKKMKLKIDISENQFEEEFSVKLTHDTETTYRNSKKEISYIIDIYSLFRDSLSIKDTFYSATIAFKNINPFYALTIKNVSEQEVDFALKFQTADKSNITIYNKKMEITSSNEKDIRKILSQYITTVFS